MERTTFVFRAEWAEVLSEYPAALRLAVYEAVIRYAVTGEVASLDDAAARIAFSFIRQDIDHDFAKFREVSERRSEAGRRGLEKRWGKDSNAIANDSKNSNAINAIANVANDSKNSYSECECECECESEKKKNAAYAASKEIATNVALSTANADDAADGLNQTNMDKKKFIDAWNDACRAAGSTMPRVQSIKGLRLNYLKARIAEYGEERVIAAFARATASPFLNGQGNRGFIANIDWVLKPNNFIKVTEGNYDTRRSTTGTTGTGYNIGTTQIDNSTDKWEGEEEKWK